MVLRPVGQDLELATVLLQEGFVVDDAESRLRIEAFFLSVLNLQIYAETLAFFVVLKMDFWQKT